MDSSAQIQPQNEPCGGCSRVGLNGPMDQKKNGEWFTTCFKCRQDNRESKRRRRAIPELPDPTMYCRRCPRALGPIDQKKNGDWFRTCSKCREDDRESKRRRRAIPELPDPTMYCTRCPRALGPIDQKKNGDWFITCSKCREDDRESKRRRRALSELTKLNQAKRRRLDTDLESDSPAHIVARPEEQIATRCQDRVQERQGEVRGHSEASRITRTASGRLHRQGE
jgi:hypothetical protein